MNPRSSRERRVWELLTQDFMWEVPADYPVQVFDESGAFTGRARLQIFEMAVTAIFAHLRPEYEWRVTQNRADSGVDFVGRQTFLEDATLRINAAITVGGQVKKRTIVKEVLGEIAGSLLRMADAINPSIFIVVLSARLSPQRVKKAREIFERQCQRHCHILDRTQIEGLISTHLDIVTEILHEGLTPAEVSEVLDYFQSDQQIPSPAVEISRVEKVLAGKPFQVECKVRWSLATSPAVRVWWRPREDDPAAILLAPDGVDSDAGAQLTSVSLANNPLHAVCSLEFVTYTIGQVDLGNFLIGLEESGIDAAEQVALGSVEVIETMRPRFFDQPYQANLELLSAAFDRALVTGMGAIGVVGSGGSGKTRMCEEFALESRRNGCAIVSAKQAKTHDAPQRLLADLLASLTDLKLSFDRSMTPQAVTSLVASYDPELALRALPALSAIFGRDESSGKVVDDQSVLSILVLLVAVWSRQAPLIIHLQDLHWCWPDVLRLLDQLMAQLRQVAGSDAASGPRINGGVLFILEGRVGESEGTLDGAWTSGPFEDFLRRGQHEVIKCGSFDPKSSRDFVRVLFEDRHNAHRLLDDELLTLQRELIDRIDSSAGGNPFHTLEQVRLLRAHGLIARNPRTGLLFIVKPEIKDLPLPDSVFAAIQRRWQFLRAQRPSLALLLWACALLEDQISADLFRHIWAALAQDVSLREIDSTDILWTGNAPDRAPAFRHENYFEALRQFPVSSEERELVVHVYTSWFSRRTQLGPADRFAWARALLQASEPDIATIRKLLATALQQCRRQGDARFGHRVAAAYLDISWNLDARNALTLTQFLKCCDIEVNLCRDLLGIDRGQAGKRLPTLQARIRERLAWGAGSERLRNRVLRRQVTADMIEAQLLFNGGDPRRATEIATEVARTARTNARGQHESAAWEQVEMEALYSLACSQGLSGDQRSALDSAQVAAELAQRSSSLLARKVISTCGAVLLAKSPAESEMLLRSCLEGWEDDNSSDAVLVHVHMSIARILQAYHDENYARQQVTALSDSRNELDRVIDSCRRLGLHADQAAAALVRGVLSAFTHEGNEATWFAQAVAAASRGQQMETLWRSHINRAISVHRSEGKSAVGMSMDHAYAAIKIMEPTLDVYSEPDQSPRFELLRLGLANAAAILIAGGNQREGLRLLGKYPSLRSHFSDPAAGSLKYDVSAQRHYQWLRINDRDLVLY